MMLDLAQAKNPNWFHLTFKKKKKKARLAYHPQKPERIATIGHQSIQSNSNPNQMNQKTMKFNQLYTYKISLNPQRIGKENKNKENK